VWLQVLTWGYVGAIFCRWVVPTVCERHGIEWGFLV
jgi:hypothetical protein